MKILRRWQILKGAASRSSSSPMAYPSATNTASAAITHPYLQAEKGTLGMAVLGDVVKRFDPEGFNESWKIIGLNAFHIGMIQKKPNYFCLVPLPIHLVLA